MIALQIAVEKPERMFWSLDRDGVSMMHLGALPLIRIHPENFIHVVIHNGAMILSVA